MHPVRRWVALSILAGYGLAGCRDGANGEDGAGGKHVPPALEVTVELEGKPAPSISATLLKKTKPDFSEPDREGWFLTTLLPTSNVAQKVIESEDVQGARVVITKPGADTGGGAPVLEIDKAGEVHVVLGRKGVPLPTTQRGGENADTQKARGIRKLRLIDPAVAQASGPKIGFRVIIDDEPTIDWTSASTKVKPFSVAASDGEGTRDVWPLRELANEIAGSNDAMITSVVGDEGGKAMIEEAQWKNETRIPVLRTNRRGAIKFTWLGDKHQGLLDAEEVRDVVKIKVKRHMGAGANPGK